MIRRVIVDMLLMIGTNDAVLFKCSGDITAPGFVFTTKENYEKNLSEHRLSRDERRPGGSRGRRDGLYVVEVDEMWCSVMDLEMPVRHHLSVRVHI